MQRILIVAVSIGLLSGCIAWQEDSARMRAESQERMNSYMDEAVINGVLAERTLYPYHFYHDTSELTALGKRTLSILASYYENHPGTLNIRQGEAPDSLYEARIAMARSYLEEWGIAIGEIDVTDDYPSGAGMPSERVFEMLVNGEGLRAESATTIGVQ